MKLGFSRNKEETVARSVIKSVVYRVSHLITFYLLAVALGATGTQGAGMVGVVLTFGTVLYFTYDRIWLLFKWDRNNGFDTQRRSIVKSLMYRVIVFVAATGTAMIVMGASLRTALTFSILDQIISLVLYYSYERLSQLIPWGKIPQDSRSAQVTVRA